MPKPDVRELEVAEVDPSKTNPRKHFNDAELNELASSIFEQGIIEPLIVRQKGKKFEIVAGERRYRANKIALARAQAASPVDAQKGKMLEKLPCIVRELSDEAAAEIQLMENEQRSDLTPLERAAGYRNLINTNPTKHTATTIAQKVGKSPAWVWDIMKLVDLIPKAKELLEAEKMTVNHAIPIARLTPKQQEKVIDPNSGGLFTHDQGFNFGAEDDDSGTLVQKFANKTKDDPWRDVKARSVRELYAYIAKHIRFDPRKAAEAAPLLFDSVAEAVATAQKLPGRGQKVISITYNLHVDDDAKTEGERTYTPQSWRRADGTENTTPGAWGKPPVDSPTCDHSVLGVVVVGPGYGEAFPVCVAREKCSVHFGDVIKEKAKREKEKLAAANGNGKPAAASKESTYAKEERERQERWQREKAEATALHKPLKKAAFEKLAALPAKLPKPLLEMVLKQLALPKDTKPEGLAEAVVVRDVRRIFTYGESTHWVNEQQQWAQALGVNVNQIRAEVFKELRAERKEKVQTPGAAKKNGSNQPSKAAAKKTTKKAAKKRAAKK